MVISFEWRYWFLKLFGACNFEGALQLPPRKSTYPRIWVIFDKIQRLCPRIFIIFDMMNSLFTKRLSSEIEVILLLFETVGRSVVVNFNLSEKCPWIRHVSSKSQNMKSGIRLWKSYKLFVVTDRKRKSLTMYTLVHFLCIPWIVTVLL